MLEREKNERELRNIQGFREWESGAVDAGKFEPAWDAGMAPQERGGEGGLLISRARATRGLGRPSLDARSRRPSRPPSLRRQRASLEGSFRRMRVLVRRAQKRATWLLPSGGDKRPMALWIRAAGCSRLARNRLPRGYYCASKTRLEQNLERKSKIRISCGSI